MTTNGADRVRAGSIYNRRRSEPILTKKKNPNLLSLTPNNLLANVFSKITIFLISHIGALSEIAWRLRQRFRTPSLAPLTKALCFLNLATEIICFQHFLSLFFLRAIFEFLKFTQYLFILYPIILQILLYIYLIVAFWTPLDLENKMCMPFWENL
jgi:hypothetical protein